MNKEAIVNLLEEKHQKLFDWLSNQPEDIFEKGPEGKWTTGQHIEHLVDSLKKLNHALSYPNFLLKYKFGTSNRELRTYKDVSQRYLDKLVVNQERARTFNINVKTPTQKKYKQLLSTLEIQNKKLQYKTKKIKDKNLDNLLLPHPLMGKMPLREIIMWTAYHTEHHTNTLIEKH